MTAPRVLHVAHNLPPHVGGLEVVVAEETRGLRARGWQVAVVGSTSAGAGGAPGSRVEGGVRVIRIRAWHGLEQRFGVPFPVFSPRLLPALVRQVRRADVVHVHDVLYLSSWMAALVCVLLRTPYVVHRHVGFVHHSSSLVRAVQGAVLATAGRFVLARSAAVLPIDEHVAAGLPASARVEVLGNGVDTERFHPATDADRRRARARFGMPADRPLVLFVGRFVPKKGFADVVAAADDAYDLVFAGGERPPGLDDPRLHFLGSLPAAEVPEAYRCADLVVVASVGECPLTVLEAMASGLPVLVRDEPALHSPWTAGPGVRFVDIGAGGLRPALRELAGDAAQRVRVGAQGRAFVERSFSWATHLDRLEDVYRDVTSR